VNLLSRDQHGGVPGGHGVQGEGEAVSHQQGNVLRYTLSAIRSRALG